MNNSTLKQYPGPHERQNGADTNKLRAAVLGANDGTVSVASIIVGVAGATNSSLQIITAGIAGLVAGAISMGVGEYVSVSSQRDTEKVLLEKERHLLAAFPEEELKELELLYKSKGLSTKTAQQVAKELSAHDVHAAHFEAELGIDPEALTNPWHAAIASSLAFTAGALVPLIVIALVRGGLRVPLTIVAVILALIATGLLSARASGASKLHSTRRVVVGGLIAMLVTYCIGYLVGHVTSG
jgi:VIT1/CCC1 family predicted Fe2+/Mn2+ transporter